jgi:hypothetical protein
VALCAGKSAHRIAVGFEPHNVQTTLQTPLQTILIACAKEGNAMGIAVKTALKTTLTTRYYVLFVAAAVIAALAMPTGSARALTMTECSAKYKDAKAANSLNGMKWNDSRKSQCDLAPSKRSSAKSTPAGTAVATNAVFPSAVDAKYSKEKPGRARRKTCLDQYKANKTGDANGGLKWLQKGGGYYSQCVKKLKTAA